MNVTVVPPSHAKPGWQTRNALVPAAIVLLIGLSWFLVYRQTQILTQAATTLYQQTQLEIVRTLARSIEVYVQNQVEVFGRTDVTAIEQEILEQFIAPVHLLENGDAWIYAPDHVVFDLSSDFPDIYRDKNMAQIFAIQAASGASHYQEMTEAVMNAREGTGWYIWLPDKGIEVAAWTPVKVDRYVWTIGLSTPLPEILASTGAVQQIKTLWTLMGLGTFSTLGILLIWVYNTLQRGRAEVALSQSRALFQSLIESLPQNIFSKDLEGRFIFANQNYCRAEGKLLTEIVGKTDYDLHPPELAEKYRADDRRVIETRQSLETVEEHQVLGGQRFYVQVIKTPLYDAYGQVVGNLGIFWDITERQRVEEALQRRNRELTLLNRVGQELSATLDLHHVNERLLQAVTETMEAENASVWLWDEAEPAWLVCRAALHRRQEGSLLNQRLRKGQGIIGWVAETGESAIVTDTDCDSRFFSGLSAVIGLDIRDLIAVPLRVRDQVIGVLEITNKSSGIFAEEDCLLIETFAASAAIAIQNAHLVETLQQHTRELQAHNEELDAFAHTAAHDLKSPLVHLIGYADYLEENYADLSDEERRQHLHSIISGGRKLVKIIDELLLLAGVRQMGRLVVESLDMAAIITEARTQLAYLIEEHQAEITTAGEWPLARGYTPWVEQVWVNYLSNGIKYGGRPPRLELGAQWLYEDAMIRFWVHDNGDGLTPEEQAQLFTPFTRLDQLRLKGYGLGLSIVRRIVERLGGQVGVFSSGMPGEGSTFWFTLPPG